MKASVIIPCYNEENRIFPTLNYLLSYIKTLDFIHEIIFVDDGSNDNTKGIIQEFRENSSIVYINLTTHKGKGAALKAGCSKATGDILIFLDADLPYDLSCLKNISTIYSKDYNQITIGDRTLPNSKIVHGYGWVRVLSGKIFSLLIKGILALPYPDTQCGLKVLPRQVIDMILKKSVIDSFTFDVEILCMAYIHNIPINRIPVIFNHSNGSKINIIKDSFTMFIDLLKIKRRKDIGLYT